MPGVGISVSFFRPGGRSFALKSCPGAGILTEKISGPGGQPGGMVTGQIDTCIISLQCGVPVAKRANSYSAAMVMTCKTGETPSNGAPPKVDTHFRKRLNLRRSPSHRGRM